MKNFKIYQTIFFLIFLLFIVNTNALAVWYEPQQDPPDANVRAPLNQSDTPQAKEGELHIGSTLPMNDYYFSVSNGASYFEGLVETVGGIQIETSAIIQGGAGLTINDNGILTINGTASQLILNGGTGAGSNISIITAQSGSSVLVRNDNNEGGSKAIAGSIGDNGTAIFGTAQSGIGVLGHASGDLGIGVVGEVTHPNALAGRFDGEVRFNSFDGFSFTDIDGGIATFTGDSGRTVVIEPPNIITDGGDITVGVGGDIIVESGDIEVESGDIEVHYGEIDMYLNSRIINLIDPVNDNDAANKQYVDAQIGGISDDGDWVISGEDIYREIGNVGIGTLTPESKLTVVYSHVGTPNTFPTGLATIKALNEGMGQTALLLNENSKNYGIYIDMFSDPDNYAAAFMNGNVGIGTENPTTALDVVGKLNIHCVGGVSDYPENAIIIGDAGFIYDSSCNLSQQQTEEEHEGAASTFHIDGVEPIIIQSASYVAIKGGGYGADYGNYGIRVNDEGLVGIGTSNPSTQLDVDGDTTISGDLTVYGDTFRVGGGMDISGDIISDGGIDVSGGIDVGNDITIGTNKIRRGSSLDSPSIEFDSNNNIVITIPAEEIIIK